MDEIIKSQDFNGFTQASIDYSRWYVVYMILDFSGNQKKYPHIPNVLLKHVIELSKQPIFEEKNSSTEAMWNMNKALIEIGKSYSKLLLSKTLHCGQSSKERFWFEVNYLCLLLTYI